MATKKPVKIDLKEEILKKLPSEDSEIVDKLKTGLKEHIEFEESEFYHALLELFNTKRISVSGITHISHEGGKVALEVSSICKIQ